MYNTIDKSKDFFVYLVSKNKHIRLGDENDMIRYYYSLNRGWSYNYSNYLNPGDLNISGKDCKYVEYITEIVKEDEFGDEYIEKIKNYYPQLKEYIFYDGYNRIIDIRKYLKKYEKSKSESKNWRDEWNERKNNYVTGETYCRGRAYRKGHGLFYKFRRGPVPGTSSVHHYGNCYRHVHYKTLRVQVACEFENKEYESYGLKLFNNQDLIDPYPCRHREKSWKKSKKCRHQWQKNL